MTALVDSLTRLVRISSLRSFNWVGSLLKTKNMRMCGSKRLGWRRLTVAMFERTTCWTSLKERGAAK